jgi:hypothetical protein
MKKKAVVFLTIIFFAISCEKDFLFTESDQTDQIELKKATVHVPMKCWFTTVADYSLDMITCSPEEMGVAVLSGGFMKGHATHGGKLKTELSCWRILDCEFDYEQGQMTGYIEGKNTVANGDYYFYTGVLHISVMTGMLSGEIIMDDGVGKFKGVTGNLVIDGVHNFELNEAVFTANGFCTFVRN